MQQNSEPRAGLEAAALRFDPTQDDIPVIMALGRGMVAEKMLALAEENRVPVVQNKELAQLLNQLSVGDAIPPQLYTVVAEVLVFVSNMDSQYTGRLQAVRHRVE